jgi:hypothetical protein
LGAGSVFPGWPCHAGKCRVDPEAEGSMTAPDMALREYSVPLAFYEWLAGIERDVRVVDLTPPEIVRLMQALAATEQGAIAGGERWRHLKRGTVYEIIGRGELQMGSDLVDGSSMVVYRGEDGRIWVREESEFEDGRFERLELPTPAADGDKVLVRKVETVSGDYMTEAGEPFWRIEINGYCADFDHEQAARNFAAQINLLAAAPAPTEEGEGHHV